MGNSLQCAMLPLGFHLASSCSKVLANASTVSLPLRSKMSKSWHGKLGHPFLDKVMVMADVSDITSDKFSPHATNSHIFGSFVASGIGWGIGKVGKM